MRISSKGRYAVATLVYISKKQNDFQHISTAKIASDLGISKLYLEQVLSILKKSKIISSVKGSSGGYRLAKSAENITVYQVLSATELGLFEETEQTLSKDVSYIDNAISEVLWSKLDIKIENFLKTISIYDIVKTIKSPEENMYYI